MLRPTTLVLTATAALFATAGPMQAQDHAPVKLSGLDWRTDLEAARAEANKTGRPIFAVFR